MATSTTALIDILNYVKTWKSNTFKIEAYKDSSYDSSKNFITNATAIYGDVNYVSGSVGARIALTSNVVLQIPANTTVKMLIIAKGTLSTHGNDWLYSKGITEEVFTYAGTITITSATITLNDA